MSWKYSLTFLMLATTCVFAGAVAWEVVHWPALPFLYVALSFALLSLAYAGVGPRLLLKRASGRRSAWGWLLFGPYFLLTGMAFHLYRVLSLELAFAQVMPNLFFGRRLTFQEARRLKWVGVLDLACEFEEIGLLRDSSGYRSLPVLDGTSPTEQQMRSVVGWLEEAVPSGPVFVHCALGHGRSACVVIAYLLSVGLVASAAEGEGLLRSLRRGVWLNATQRQQLRKFES